MPGHILIAECPCGFSRSVQPGLALPREGKMESRIIAYDAWERDLITVDEAEAKALGLECLPDPFIEYWTHSMYDPRVQAAGSEPTFRCPKCDKETMRFGFLGHWD